MARIIEHIGKEGVISTDCNWARQHRPSVGDAILVPLGLKYPFHTDESNPRPFVARIDRIEDGKVHICMHASVYWSSKDHVSISGGPFHSLPLEVLKFERMELVRFWNFANGSGAGMGCEYWVERPAYTFNYEDWKKE